jgi:hypothetical protein
MAGVAVLSAAISELYGTFSGVSGTRPCPASGPLASAGGHCSASLGGGGAGRYSTGLGAGAGAILTGAGAGCLYSTGLTEGGAGGLISTCL